MENENVQILTEFFLMKECIKDDWALRPGGQARDGNAADNDSS